MVALVRSRRLDLSENAPDEARVLIKEALQQEPTATRKIYAALAHKVWSLLIERRLDDEIRDWHGLLQTVRANIRPSDDAAAERVTALSDLLRESISLAETSPAREVAQRPRARAILDYLARHRDFVPRRRMMKELEIGTSHLSNILTQLVALGLIERREAGKEASFALTTLGREIILGRSTSEVSVSVMVPKDVPDRATAVLDRVILHASISASAIWHDDGLKPQEVDVIRFKDSSGYHRTTLLPRPTASLKALRGGDFSPVAFRPDRAARIAG